MTTRLYWKTKEGTKLKISEMETSHLINCANLMIRKGFIKNKDLILAQRERIHNEVLESGFPQFSGEMAQECAERDYYFWIDHWDDLEGEDPKFLESKLPALVAIERELKKRRVTQVVTKYPKEKK